jgi:hypothetical protein
MALALFQGQFFMVCIFEYIQIILLLHLILKDLRNHLGYRFLELLCHHRRLLLLRLDSFIAFTLVLIFKIIGLFTIVITLLGLSDYCLLKLLLRHRLHLIRFPRYH